MYVVGEVCSEWTRTKLFVYIVSEVCSEWTRTKLFVYIVSEVCSEWTRTKLFVYIVSEVCSEWTRKKLFVYVFLYAIQSMTPHTWCMIVLLNYINVFLLPPLHILFPVNDCVSASSFSLQLSSFGASSLLELFSPTSASPV